MLTVISKRVTPAALCLLLAPMPFAVAQEIFRHVERDGSVVFTDQPPEDAPVVDDGKARPSGVAPMTGAVANNEPKPLAADVTLPITAIAVRTPADGATLSNMTEKIWVEVETTPSELPQAGLVAQLWLDGRIVSSSELPTLTMPVPFQGSHLIYVTLVDTDGTVVAESPTSSFLVSDRLAGHDPD